MKDRTYISADAVPTARTITPLPAAPLTQQDEFVRRARIATAQAAVNATSRNLASTYLPMAERSNLAREHEANLLRLARVRVEYGVGTLADHRLVNPKQAKAIEDRFWSNDESWVSADNQMAADLAALNTAGAQS